VSIGIATSHGICGPICNNHGGRKYNRVEQGAGQKVDCRVNFGKLKYLSRKLYIIDKKNAPNPVALMK
jgi:hypothetical protein